MNSNQTTSQVRTEVISIGQRVHCILYGGKDGTVVKISGNQMPQTVSRLSGGIGVSGGSAQFYIIWDNGTQSTAIPESLLRASVQWRIYDEVVSAEEIALAWANVAIQKATAQAKADEAKQAYQCACEQALKDFPKLAQIGEGQYGNGKFAAKNIRTEIKAAWPGVKFSVTSDHDSVRVFWTDGPTQRQVEDIVDKYNNGGFDSMQDIATDEPTAFTDLFGGARYLSYSREYSSGLLSKAIDALYQRLPENLATIERPNAEDVNHRQTDRIPHLDQLTVSEATRSIVRAWDDASKSYQDQSRFYGSRWIIFSS
jgi:hypothetical protein